MLHPIDGRISDSAMDSPATRRSAAARMADPSGVILFPGRDLSSWPLYIAGTEEGSSIFEIHIDDHKPFRVYTSKVIVSNFIVIVQ